MWKSAVLSAVVALSAAAQQPPLIDRELLFDDPELSGSQISPDGKYIAFLKPWNKTRNVWVKKAEEPFASARLVTSDPKRPIPGYFWSRDSKYILFVQDTAGDENFNVHAVDPAAKAAAGAEAPPARNVTDVKGVRAAIYAVPKSDPDTLYVGLNDRDKAWHDLYKVKISTGERTLIRKNTDRITSWIFDLNDQLRLATRSADNGDTEILRVDADGFKKIYSCDWSETCSPGRFHKDNQRVYLRTNRGNPNLVQLALLDPATGKEEVLESDPERRVDLSGLMISEVSNEIVSTMYYDAKPKIYWKDKGFEADYKKLQQQFGDRQVNFVSSTADERQWIVSVNSDTEPGETVLFDRTTKKITPQYKIRDKINRSYLAKMEPIRYESAEGLEIPAYLTLPKGVPAKNLPLVIVPHGGPWGRDGWGFNGLAQFLANRGYAVLQPNFRSSTGYGKKFLNAGDGQWGEKMQDDLTSGVKHLIAKGIADPKRVGIMGGSYGGYATLAGVAFTPDVYAAGVSIVGPSNLITLLDSIPAYWEAGRIQLYKRMADPRTPEGKAKLERQSPVNSAAKIKTPLLVVQGANDPRVNKNESDQIVVALRDRKFPVEYLVAPDEGHGFARPVNNMAMFAAAEKFLAKHLGGRYQESMTPEVGARLKEITVDPATVVLKPKADPASAQSLPKITGTLIAGVSTYNLKVQQGERSIDMKLTTEIKDQGDSWAITDTMSTPMGDATDSTMLDKSTLVLRKRSAKQGPMALEMSVQGNKATGTVTMQGAAKPLDVDLGGPLFADAAGAMHSMAALPLAEGYTTVLRNFDIQKLKTKLVRLTVAGQESVTVPAGTFIAWKLDVGSAEGGPEKATLWVAKDSRKPLKMAMTSPQMGGATMTLELQ